MTFATDKAAILAQMDATRAAVVALVCDAVVPPQPTPGPLPAITIELINPAKILAFRDYMLHPDRYERFQNVTVDKVTGGIIKMFGLNLASGGTALAVGTMTVTITLTPKAGGPVITLPAFTPSPTAVDFEVPIPGTAAPGWYMATVAGAAGWSTPTWPVCLCAAGAPKPTTMPVTSATWDMLHNGNKHIHAMVPAVFNPVTMPYPVREFPPLPGMPTRATVVETQLVICRPEDIYRPSLLATMVQPGQSAEGTNFVPRIPGADGTMVTPCIQPYSYGETLRKSTRLASLDGIRGRGNVVGPQDLKVGRNGKVRFCEGNRYGRVVPDGTVITLVGHRDIDIPTFWTDRPQRKELMGDWTGVAVQGINECWGIADDSRTFPLDPTGTQHAVDVITYLPDRLNNRILKLVSDGQDLLVPVRVSVWKNGTQPWECVEAGPGRLAISWWGENRIAVYDMDSGAEITSWPANRPEGLFYLDGFIYYTSLAMKEVRKRDVNGSDQLHVALGSAIDGNSLFSKIAFSDGSFGPRGMMGLVTWSGNGFGYPILYHPNGTRYAGYPFPGASGPGLPWQISSAYPSAIAFGHERMVFGTVQEGIRVHSMVLPTDTDLGTPAYLAGKKKWRDLGYHLTHGHDGFGFFGLQQPWGDPDIDVYLKTHGHTP